jgi:hypothetical protein
MRSLLLTATLIAAAIGLSGCPYHRPVPGPQSSAGAALHFGGSSHARQQEAAHGPAAPGEITWFQGTLEEAFARPACPYAHSQLRGGGASRYNPPRLGL